MVAPRRGVNRCAPGVRVTDDRHDFGLVKRLARRWTRVFRLRSTRGAVLRVDGSRQDASRMTRCRRKGLYARRDDETCRAPRYSRPFQASGRPTACVKSATAVARQKRDSPSGTNNPAIEKSPNRRWR